MNLTAAFIFGRVFMPFLIDIRQTPDEVWTTNATAADADPFEVRLDETGNDGQVLSLEIMSGLKNVSDGVDAFLTTAEFRPSLRLQLRPPRGRLAVDNSLCRAMVRQTYAELERVMRTDRISEIHVFAAVRQSFMLMLGKQFRGMPPAHLYEWDGTEYLYCCRVPGGVL